MQNYTLNLGRIEQMPYRPRSRLHELFRFFFVFFFSIIFSYRRPKYRGIFFVQLEPSWTIVAQNVFP